MKYQLTPWQQEIADQSAHFLLAALAVLIVQPPHIWQAAALGLMLGLTREFTEGGNIISKGSLIDMFHWTLGGLAMGIIRAAA